MKIKNEIITDDYFATEQYIETQGVRTHFWLEQTYFDEEIGH